MQKKNTREAGKKKTQAAVNESYLQTKPVLQCRRSAEGTDDRIRIIWRNPWSKQRRSDERHEHNETD